MDLDGLRPSGGAEAIVGAVRELTILSRSTSSLLGGKAASRSDRRTLRPGQQLRAAVGLLVGLLEQPTDGIGGGIRCERPSDAVERELLCHRAGH
ncbi:hypothetical protein Cob_v007983 [Colletotrichum orbiculare MAFF 240422]|uniref:Uncharacterized protein n=1 Tax=Colletotrichum orbiculare (strain 104-T / ATCC 96160 / CBS 514.97 / LARS 414 / MAFF 240422) TaxID=1213857 RepID=A0A484FKU1_COLOR|nr:hypothetical protein Cob_v007983 [Colletotrichum orbiculare MAFF 240422]